MNAKILSEDELKTTINKIYKEEQIKIIKERWELLEDYEKKFVVEFLKLAYPEKGNLIKEAKWYNLIGDIVGIFDPTGIVDIINGISYWRQDDKLFAILSWISAIPYVGDLVGKPVIGLFKAGGALTKLFKAAFLAKNTAGMAKLASTSPLLMKFLKSTSTWGPKILEWVVKITNKIPFLGKGMAKTLSEWISVLGKAGKETKAGKKIFLTGAAGQLGRALTMSEKKLFLNQLKSGSEGLFKGYKALNPSLWNKLRGGVPRLWGNRSVRSLMGRTKWYLGLLDFLGFANFVGPDELDAKVENLDQKIDEYTKTQESNKNWEEEFGLSLIHI